MPKPDHDGCAYPATVNCWRKDKPGELCPAGYVVYRNQWGGHHHVSAQSPAERADQVATKKTP